MIEDKQEPAVVEDERSVKRSHVVETHWEQAIIWGGLGVFSLLLGLFFNRYGYDWFFLDLRSLAWLFLGLAPVLLVYAGYRGFVSRKVGSFPMLCPYCSHETVLTKQPRDDYVCDGCTRRVAIKDGQVLEVTGVRCGFCGAVNYMSEKTEVLICEECDREIPLLNPETGEMRHAPKGFARVDDDSLYELVLTDAGKNREAVITSLQHMLALNRSQVKKILDELPQTLLTGINRRKAEMLRAQIEASEAVAELRPIERT